MKKYFTLLLLALLVQQLHAQDVHFSQFYAEPWFINPAKTGFFPGNYRLSGAYRSQWRNVTSPYKTFAASGELGWEWKGASKDVFGIGAHAYSDRSGDANYSVNNFGVTTAYTFGLDRWQQQFFGIGAGINYVSTGFDPTHLRFDNEYTGIASHEKYVVTQTHYVDFSGGFEYNFIPSEKFNLDAGFAVQHLNEPHVSYMNDDDSKVYRNLTFNFGATYTIANKYQFYPRLLFAHQGPHNEVNTGTFVKLKIDKARKETYGLYLGSWYRWNDAVIPVLRFDMNDLSIGMSYDINTSKLYTASQGRGGGEMTLLYTGFLPKMSKRRVVCPRF